MNINWQPSHLFNLQVQLLPLMQEHFDSLYELASDPLVWEQHPEKDRYKRDVFTQFFEIALNSGSAFAIVDVNTNTIIGSSRFYDYNAAQSSVAIGYTFLGRAYWGGTYNRELKNLMIDYAFQYVQQIFFHVGIHNIRSQKAVLKLGADFKEIIEFKRLNEVTLSHAYVLYKERWNGLT